MARKEIVQAIAYFRTSSAANVGEDKDTLKRQRAAVEAFAKAAGYELTGPLPHGSPKWDWMTKKSRRCR